jgi:hypothetical protein
LKEAEELEVKVIQTRKRALRDEHPDILNRMHNHNLTFNKQGDIRRQRSCKWKSSTYSRVYSAMNIQIL